MNETWPRWQGRIGSSKAGRVRRAVRAGYTGEPHPSLQTALNNPTQPQRVQIGQLVSEEIGKDQYVTAAGIAVYQLSYEETENNKHVASYYGLLNAATGDLIFVRTKQPLPTVEQEAATITGMTAPSRGLSRCHQERFADAARRWSDSNPNLYLADGEKPARPAS